MMVIKGLTGGIGGLFVVYVWNFFSFEQLREFTIYRVDRPPHPLSNFLCFKTHASQFDNLLYLCGCPWNRITCSRAAGNGKLDCLKYAHENGCRWDKSTTFMAAANAHLSCLQYACENGCTLHYEALGHVYWALTEKYSRKERQQPNIKEMIQRYKACKTYLESLDTNIAKLIWKV